MSTKPAPLLLPFAGVLPAPDKAHLVATRSYLTYSDYELKDKLARNPYSYLHVIHPEGELESGGGMGAIRAAYEGFLARGWLHCDTASHYYVLQQRGPLGSATGVVGLVPTAAAQAGHIKVHESTLSHRESLFARYLSEVGLNAEPTLLAHEDNATLNGLLAEVKSGRPDLDFTTADGVRHTLWRTQPDQGAALESAYSRIESAYIADGHHRVASSIRMAEHHPDRPDAGAFMALMVPENELIFRGFHRILRLHDLDIQSTVEQLMALPGIGWTPAAKGLYPGASEIVLHGAVSGTLSIGAALAQSGLTAPEWLQQQVLAPLFGIEEPRTDPRLSYLPGDVTDAEILQAAGADNTVAFVMPALDFAGLKAVADAGRFMPPKSTWIAPKLRSGLTLFDFGPAS